jgi:hypothetical protein
VSVIGAFGAVLALVIGCDVLRRRDTDLAAGDYRTALYAGCWFLAAVAFVPATL